MNLTNIEWYAVPADALGDVLIRGVDEHSQHGKDVYRIHAPRAESSPERSISIGVVRDEGPARSRNYRPPVIAVLPRGNAGSDVLAWTSAFMPELAPIGQYLRVVSHEDWELVEAEGKSWESPRTDRWACIGIGELLGTTKQPDSKQIDISNHYGCLSTTMGMAAYSGGELSVRACSDRLRHLFKYPGFARPRVSVDHLTNSWALLNIQDLGRDIVEIVHLVVNAVEDRIRWSPRYSNAGIQHFPELSSDSIESRVVAFSTLLTAIVDLGVTGEDATEACALHLAAAAFLVGRSTSHAFLLNRLPERAVHQGFVYFSLFAALVGPDGWDASWSRAVKNIERTIRQPLDISQPSIADIGWMELTWTLSARRSTQPVTQLAARQRGVVSIEIVPGALLAAKLSAPRATEANELSASAIRKNTDSLQVLLRRIQEIERDVREMLPRSSGIDARPLDRPVKRGGYRAMPRKDEDEG